MNMFTFIKKYFIGGDSDIQNISVILHLQVLELLHRMYYYLQTVHEILVVPEAIIHTYLCNFVV